MALAGSAVLLERTAPAVQKGGGGPSGGAFPPGGGEPDGRGGGLAAEPARLGLYLFLGTVAMLFLGFTSAYLVRRTSADWRSVPMPLLFWANTALLAASSVAVERARRVSRRAGPRAARGAFLLAGGLGLAFAAGQVTAWRALLGSGFFLSNPHAAFLYVLTGVHLVHLAGGIAWAAAAAVRLPRATGRDPLALFATYWHFLGLLWLYLLGLLFVV